MKSTIAALLVLTSVHGFAAESINKKDQKTVLKELVGKLGTVNTEETRTYFFTNGTDRVVTVVNSKDDLSIMVDEAHKYNSIYASLAKRNDTSTTISKVDGKRVLTQTATVEYKGAPAVYSVNTVSFSTSGDKSFFTIDAAGTSTIYFKYNGKGQKAPLKNPEVSTLEVHGAHFILGLTEKEMVDLGAVAAKKANEDREARLSECSLDVSGHLLRCDYYLSTEYADDTLHSIFSIKDGKVSELLEVELEHGC